MRQKMSVHELDAKIYSELERVGYIRRKDLLEVLKVKHAKEKGFSTTSLNRRIGELIGIEKIRVVEPKEFADYGISDDDKRAKYLISASYARKKGLVDYLLDKFSKGDSFEKYLAIKGIKRNLDEYTLNPVQISCLSTYLNSDEHIDALVIEILHEALLKRSLCIGEDYQDSLLANVYNSLVKYGLPPSNTNKKLLLEILGFFSAETVVDMLQVDLERVMQDKELLSKDDDEKRETSWIKAIYHSKYLVHAFEEEKDRLNELIWKYTETGKKEGPQNERKVALIIDDLLDYVAKNKDKAIYYEKVCGAQK